tara:strand:+ start:2018 stop:2248 length:231 start_codon:yes stop_codon:yes gene_type:complete
MPSDEPSPDTWRTFPKSKTDGPTPRQVIILETPSRLELELTLGQSTERRSRYAAAKHAKKAPKPRKKATPKAKAKE